MSNHESSHAGASMSLGSLIVRILGEIRAMAANNADGAPLPNTIVTARAVLSPTGSNSSNGEESNNTRHVIIFLGGSSAGIFGSASLGDFASSEGDFEHILARLAQLHQPQGPPPATKAALDALPLVYVDEEALVESPQCPICCEGFCVGTEVCKLPCQHFFDRVCVMEWLTKHNTCPICRYELPVDDTEREQSRKERMAARGIDEDAFFATHALEKSKDRKKSPKKKRKDRDVANTNGTTVETTLTTTSTAGSEPDARRVKKRRKEENGKEKEKHQEKEQKEEKEEEPKRKKRKRDLQGDVPVECSKDRSCERAHKKSKSAPTEEKNKEEKKTKKNKACGQNVQASAGIEKEASEPRKRRWAKRTKHEAV